MGTESKNLAGNASMLLLQLLSEKDMYGYEMIETLQERSQQMFELKAGTLYPLLHGLEAQGQLTVYEKEVQGKVRKYYQITKKGRKALENKRKEWEEYSRAVSQVMGGAVYVQG